MNSFASYAKCSKSYTAVPPSKVVHCRGVSDYVTGDELAHAVSQYGPVEFVLMMPNKGMALVEMGTVPAAEALVAGATQQPIVLHGRRVLFNFSKVGGAGCRG